MCLRKKSLIVIAILLLSRGLVYSTTPRNSAQRIISAVQQNETSRITKKTYLDPVYVIMRAFLSDKIFFSNKETTGLLREYRSVILKSTFYNRHQLTTTSIAGVITRHITYKDKIAGPLN